MIPPLSMVATPLAESEYDSLTVLNYSSRKYVVSNFGVSQIKRLVRSLENYKY